MSMVYSERAGMPNAGGKFLHAGQYYVTRQGMRLETLVGSCVAVCLYNYKSGMAGMNHYLLCRKGGGDEINAGRFGDSSTELIIRKMLAADDKVNHIKGFVYGGAAVLSGKGKRDVGRENAEIAEEILGKYRIRIAERQIGGSRGRRILFDTSTGQVQWRYSGDIPRKKGVIES